MDTSSGWAFVGRGDELALVAEALASPDVHGIVLVGPRGVGKTRLATECLRIGEEAGYATARVVATRSASELPLGALAPLLPDLSGDGPDLLTMARRSLAERASGAPLLLFVDDGHLLDETSATLLLHLAADPAVFVVVTVRRDEPVHDAVTALWKDGFARRIDIDELGADEMDALAVAILGGQIEDTAADRLRQLASGNPLAMRELVLGAVEAGALQASGGRWSAPEGLPVSNRLSELVSERIGGLADGERDALELVVLGEPLGLDVVGRLVDPADLEELERKRLVEIRTEDRRVEVWLSHPLHGEVVRSRLPVLRRRALLRRLTESLAATGAGRGGDTLRLAMWRLELGDRDDPGLLVEGARQAYVAHDLVRAVSLAVSAWRAERSVEAGHLAGHVRCQLGEHEEAEAVLAETEQLLVGSGPSADGHRVLVAMARSENLFRSDRGAEAIAVLEAAEAAVTDEDWRAELIGHRATLIMLSGEARAAFAVVAPFLEHPSPRPFVQAAIAGATTMAYDGRALDAADLARRAFAVHAAIWHQELFQSDPGVHAFSELLALTQSGSLTEAEGMAAAFYEMAAASQNHGVMAALALQRGIVGLERGRLRTALDWFERSADLYGRHGPVQRRRFAESGILTAAALLGDVARAQRAEAAIDAAIAGGSILRFMEPAELVGRSWLRLAEGHPAAAQALLEDAVALGVERGLRSSALGALDAVARQGHGARAAELLEGVSGTGAEAGLQGELAAARVDHIRALAAADPAGLAAASERFEAIGADLSAAEAAADASRAHAAAGAPREARLAVNRARALAAKCEGAATPALAIGEDGVALTKREREVAHLAARGLSAREIAERLFLSHRTVENHLQRVYEKTGASGRAALVAALGPLADGTAGDTVPE